MGARDLNDERGTARILWPMVLCALISSACSEAGPDREYAEERVVDSELRPAQAGASNSDRFNRPNPHAGGSGMSGGQSGAGSGAPAPAMRWSTPEGWTELPANSMRLANLVVEGDAGKAECYLSVLPGDAGGAAANVDRWRGQMGLEGLGEAGLADLERRTLLGQEALVVDVEGNFTGMDGSQQEGARLLGMILSLPTGTLFVKMTGPGALLEVEREHFLEFCDSVHLETEGHAAAPAGADSSGPSGPSGPANAPSTGLEWQAPEGWTESAPRPMRDVSFDLGTDGTECYVAVLPGAAGGVAPNLQRWRGQLGLDPLGSAELGALESIEVLGVDSPMIEAYGRYEGMDGKAIEEGGMFGLVCSQGSKTIFVKLIGTAETVRESGDEFRAFCESLEWKP